ncbi:MAG: hypothetical protein ACUVSK_04860 [Desulfotomaculales bacterium]
MYSVKQIQLLMGALPLADVTAYYMDIRAFGKGYEEFFTQAAEMGAGFVRGRVAQIAEKENGNILLSYEDIERDRTVTAEHDLVVLSVGLLAGDGAAPLFPGGALARGRPAPGGAKGKRKAGGDRAGPAHRGGAAFSGSGRRRSGDGDGAGGKRAAGRRFEAAGGQGRLL